MSRPVILPADAELAAVTILRQRLSEDGAFSAVPVGTKRLPEQGDPFILVRRVGGAMTTPVSDSARIDVMVFYADDFNRMALATRCRAWLYASLNDDGVQRVGEILGPSRVPDPADKAKQVVLFTVSLTVRAP